MITAEQIYLDSKNKDLPINFKRSTIKFFNYALLRENFSNEKILFGFIGFHNYKNIFNHDGQYAYIMTNKRLVFANSKNIEFIDIRNINLYLIKSNININCDDKSFNINLNTKKEAKKIFELINQTIHDIKNNIQIESINENNIIKHHSNLESTAIDNNNEKVLKMNNIIEEKETTKKARQLYILKSYIAGINNYLSKSEIKEYVEYNYDFDSFEDYPNKEILEDDYHDEDNPLWQYSLSEFNTVELIFEPENQFDKNAIKIVHDKLGLIGYVPKDFNKEVKYILENYYDVSVEFYLTGGKFKYIDYYSEKVVTKSKPYYFNIEINYYKEELKN